ncbi:MAG: hypothetical protein Q4E91_13535, partial [Lachnospiraceae bacterium]|nr:hypothetical protein [Lachnospiraceae bacterium]
MKNGQWFQKILQCLIAVTGSYILYRGGGILAETGWLKQMFQSEKTVNTMQDAAVGLYFPGYVQSLKNPPEDFLLHSWLKELMPVLEEWYEEARRQQESTVETAEEQETEETDRKLQEGEAEERETKMREQETAASESEIQNGKEGENEAEALEEAGTE